MKTKTIQPPLTEGRAAEKASRVKRTESLGRARRACWQSLPDIVDVLIERALKGELAHIKLLLELGGLDRGALAVQTRESKKKKPYDMLDRWLKQEAEREAAEAEAKAAQTQNQSQTETNPNFNLVPNLNLNLQPDTQNGDAYDA